MYRTSVEFPFKLKNTTFRNSIILSRFYKRATIWLPCG